MREPYLADWIALAIVALIPVLPVLLLVALLRGICRAKLALTLRSAVPHTARMRLSNTSIISDVTPYWWPSAWDAGGRPEVRDLLGKATEAIATLRGDLEEIRVCRGGIEVRITVIDDDADRAYAKAEALRAVLDTIGDTHRSYATPAN